MTSRASTTSSSTRVPKRLRDVLGGMPARPQPRFRIVDTVRIDGGVRSKIEFDAEPADTVLKTPPDIIRAYLFTPEHRPGSLLPAIVAIHQDGPQSHIGKSEPAGIVGDPTLFYGLELFRRGYVVICPDRFEHAERRRVTPNDLSSIAPERDDDLVEHWVGQLLLRGRTAFGKEAYDLMVATDILQSLPYVDSRRIGTIGHSAGGNAMMYFMFCDQRIACGVSSCGIFSEESFYAEDAPKRRMSAFALPGLLKAGSTADYLASIAPRPVLLTRGLWEWGREGPNRDFSIAHVNDTRTMVTHAQRRYDELGASDRINAIYFDDDGGNHALPPRVKSLAYEWIDHHLTG
jgi:dienelactone hydrolase